MPSNVARPPQSNSPKPKRLDKSNSQKVSTRHHQLWIALAILGGLGLIAFVLILRLLLPLLLLLGLIALGYWIWQAVHRHYQHRRRLQTRLNAQFYQLLKHHQGRISAIDFAMFAQIDGLDAQDYLNEQAQAFSAYCETTIQGDIVYVFNLRAIAQPTQYETARVAWAWAEQAQARRAYLEKAQADWISAQQMQALRRSPKRTTEKPLIPAPAPPDEYRDLSGEERLQIQTGQGRYSATLQYSTGGASRPQLKAAQDKSHPAPKRQPARFSPSGKHSIPSDEDVITIEVKAIRS